MLAAFVGLCAGQTGHDPSHGATGEAVLAVYRLMEKAARTGDGQLLLSLYDPKTLNRDAARIENMRKGFRPLPSVRYQPVTIRVQGGEAVIIGHVENPGSRSLTHQYHSVMFRLVGNDWKISGEVWDQSPIDPASAYALLPPDDGAFARAGSAWEKIPYATPNTKYYKTDDPEMRWKLQATEDESFLYVRIEAETPFPDPGSEIGAEAAQRIDTGTPSGWPVMTITVRDSPQRPERHFSLQVSASIGDRATFDEAGKANSHHHFLSYALSVRRGEDKTVFTNSAPDSASRLLAVHDHFIDLRIPLKALGVDAAGRPRIEIGDANRPVTKILPYAVSRFPG